MGVENHDSLKFDHLIFLNGNHSQNGFIAIGCKKEIVLKSKKIDFNRLSSFMSEPNEWKFGYVSYDVKNKIENLSSSNFDGLKFPEIHFFIPKTLFKFEKKKLTLVYGDKTLLSDIYTLFFDKNKDKTSKIRLNPRISKNKYFASVKKIKEHLQQGNLYEMNFCYEFYNENAQINPFETYKKLNSLTNAPYSCFMQLNNKYILSASPERFIKKEGVKITSQPIKGTISRGKTEKEDILQIESLKNNQKERSENIMIVDLVRNDLSKIAIENSVIVEELCQIYTFETVHQMISTISCETTPETTFVDILKATFPMGSMTGAPKIRAMELIEQYESTKRGIYSGCVGYVTPDGNFDFNVIIRTLLYNADNNYLSCMVGGAITNKSNEHEEYQETLLKVEALLEALE